MFLYYTERPARGLPEGDAMTPTMNTATTIAPLDVRVTRHIDAASERVFDAWLDPASIAQWFGLGLGDMVRIDVDPRRGGRFVFTQRRGNDDVEHSGEYLVFDRPRRLAFTWAVPKVSNEFARVGIDIRPREDGCDVTLTHELNPAWADHADRTREAWAKMIDVIGRLAAK
jgi:uncharacterized protein YndB with AHSA1/START domain